MRNLVIVLLLLLGACTATPPRSLPPVIDSSGQASLPPPQEPEPVIGAPAPTTSSRGAVIALLERADGYHRSGDTGSEAATIERALRIDPRNAALWSRLAATRLAQGQARQAEQLALKSNALSGDDRRLQASNWALVAKARWSLNDSAGARAAERKAREVQE